MGKSTGLNFVTAIVTLCILFMFDIANENVLHIKIFQYQQKNTDLAKDFVDMLNSEDDDIGNPTIRVADFATFAMAKSGVVGSNFRSLPERFLSPSSLTVPREKDSATCEVDEVGISNNYCEKTDVVISRVSKLSEKL